MRTAEFHSGSALFAEPSSIGVLSPTRRTSHSSIHFVPTETQTLQANVGSGDLVRVSPGREAYSESKFEQFIGQQAESSV